MRPLQSPAHPRRRTRILLYLSTSLLLLIQSVLATLVLFFIIHHIRIIPTYSIPLSFNANIAHATLPPLPTATRALHARIYLVLPESDTNLAHSVFSISICASLCTRTTAVLRYRSAAHRAARAVLLALPHLAGITDEYQRVSVRARIPAENGARQLIVEILAPVQIAQADMRLRVEQASFFIALPRKSFILATVALWLVALLTAALVAQAAKMAGGRVAAILERVWPSAARGADGRAVEKRVCDSGNTVPTLHKTDQRALDKTEPTLGKTERTLGKTGPTASEETTTHAGSRWNLFSRSESDTSDSTTAPSSAVHGATLRRRANAGGMSDKAPDCLVNGRY